MKIDFHTGNVAVRDSIKAHYKGAIGHLKELMGRLHGDDDTSQVLVRMHQNKHHTGNKYEVSAHLKGKRMSLHASTQIMDLDKGAHALYEKLKRQIVKKHSRLQMS